MRTIRAENLVIGSGPSGATTAAMLAKAGRDVLIIEEGKYHSLDSAPPFSLDEMDQKYRAGGLTTAFGKTNITYVEGKCVGGASEINAALYHRPLPETVASWGSEYKIRDMSPDDMFGYFDDIEKIVKVSTYPKGAGPASQLLKDGADACGWSSHEVPRFWKHRKRGRGWSNKRQSMTETMIPRAVASGARLQPNTRVTKLIIKGDQAVGAIGYIAHDNGETEHIRVDFQHLFVCAGAVQTPLLLRRSGIVKNIGNQLRLHPMVRVAARFPQKFNDPSWGVPVQQVDEFKPEITLGCSHSSPPHIALWLTGKNKRELLQEWERFGVFYVAAVGQDNGTVRALPFMDQPLVRYPFGQKDRALVAKGLKSLCELLFAAGADTIWSPIEGDAPFTKPNDLSKFDTPIPNNKVNVTTIHLFSSCPMGEDKGRCAVDSWGRLHDYRNISLHDASILPTSPAVNPQGTIMAISSRNTMHYLSQLHR